MRHVYWNDHVWLAAFLGLAWSGLAGLIWYLTRDR
jgi:hypothetical protein